MGKPTDNLLELNFRHADILAVDMWLVEHVVHQKDAGHGLGYRPIIGEVGIHVRDHRDYCLGEVVAKVGNVAAVVGVGDGLVGEGEDTSRGAAVLAKEML